MEKPGVTELADKAGISKSYACEILGERVPAPGLAVHIYRCTGWKHPSIAGLTETQMEGIELVSPWKPQSAEAAE